ncbi:hypothetical protein Pan44_10730 [Caulifigura coniformis]|uniref:Peptidase C-terminal archaeal/bacterial domain-containing protein n=1 Tax=Caulifigura coniformis TaxID=2527983 RepID=A0A517SAB5_9PLAN|nr:PPC domain-containing protein [Caulifigura coniformis]QDT53058.1 hypothetical protein Pan44_10730 [Caulifigura coniformis]
MRKHRLFFIAAILFGGPRAVLGGAPSIERFFPAGGKRGTEFTLNVVGAGFERASEILFYSPGVECLALKPTGDNELEIRLKSREDAAIGPYAFRLRNPQGLSELHTVLLTNQPVEPESEPNDEVSKANEKSRNLTWAGVLENGDVDCYAITLKKGERLAAEVASVRSGSVLLDTSIRVFSPDGALIGSVDDTPLFYQDPFITLIAPQDGRYVVEVQGTNRDGDDNSRYLLSLGDFPRPAAVYPAGGQAGMTVKVQFRGDAAGDFEQSFALPESPAPGFGLIASRDGREAPSASPFRVSPFPNVLEEIRGPSPAQLPAAFNGVLSTMGEADTFEFNVSNREPIQFESFAYRIGSPIDTVIAILDGEGETLISNDDDGSHDSRLVFVPPAPGKYSLEIRDKRRAGRPDFIYRVEATRLQPQLTAFVSRPERLSQERQTVAVPRGNRIMTTFAVQRRHFKGDVQLSTSGGPQGVLFSEARIDADRYWTPTIVEASKDAPLNAMLIDVLASGNDGDRSVQGKFQQVVDLIAGSADALFQSAVVDRLAVVVIEPVPFHVDLLQPEAPVAKDGTLDLQLKLTREPGFTGSVEVVIPFLPPWVDGPSEVVIKPGETMAVYRLRAHPKAAVREWTICAEAMAGGRSGRRAESALPGANDPLPVAPPPEVAVASELVKLTVGSSPVAGKLEEVVTEQGAAVSVSCSIEAHGQLPETMTAELEGLPNRVTASPVAIARGEGRVQFELHLAPDAPVGVFPDLVVRLTGTLNGESVSYCVGRSGTLRVEPRGGLFRDESGRALSRLEVLQRATAGPKSEGK